LVQRISNAQLALSYRMILTAAGVLQWPGDHFDPRTRGRMRIFCAIRHWITR